MERVILALGLSLAGLLLTVGGALASECVRCHTDSAKLQQIAKSLPKAEASAETAGKG